MSEYMKKVEEDIAQADRLVARAVEAGSSPTDAINRHAHTAESYAAMLKKYDLKPTIPD